MLFFEINYFPQFDDTRHVLVINKKKFNFEEDKLFLWIMWLRIRASYFIPTFFT